MRLTLPAVTADDGPSQLSSWPHHAAAARLRQLSPRAADVSASRSSFRVGSSIVAVYGRAMGEAGSAGPGEERRILFDDANVAQRLMRQLGGTRGGAWLFSRLLHRLDLPVMRYTGGRRSVTAAVSGLPMLELITTGARTGRPRTMPIIGTPDADRFVLVASNYGSARNPGWYFNLKAHPECTVVVRGRRWQMEAYEAEGEERERLWALDCSVYPARRHYAARTAGRRIPVMVLHPVQP